jgi:hypothetical protein
VSTSGPASRTPDHVKGRALWPLSLAAVVLTCFLLLVVFAAVGVRGTDQYWYVGDLAMHLEQGRYASNLVYPSYSLNDTTTQLPPPMHHVPVSYLAQLWVGLGLAPYTSWVVTNVLTMLVTAALVFGAARTLNLGRLSIVPAILFVSFPLTYWQTVNALADMSLAMGAAGVLLGALSVSTRRSRTALLVTALSVSFLFWSRDDFALVLVAFLAYCAWLVRARILSWRLVALVAAGTVVLAPLKALLLPKHPSNGVSGALFSQESMDFYYFVPEFALGPLSQKAVNGLINAFMPAGATELATELPVLFAVVFGLWAARDHSEFAVLRYWTIVFFVTYVAVCAVFQAQNRYILPLVPAASVLLVAGLSVWIERHPALRDNRWVMRAATVGVVLVFVVMSSLMARHYRAEADLGAKQMDELARDLEDRTSGPLLAVGDSAQIIQLSYAVLPRPVLAVDPELNAPLSAGELIARWGVVYAVGSEEHLDYFREVADQVPGGADVVSRGPVQTPGGELELWMIE